MWISWPCLISSSYTMRLILKDVKVGRLAASGGRIFLRLNGIVLICKLKKARSQAGLKDEIIQVC